MNNACGESCVNIPSLEREERVGGEDSGEIIDGGKERARVPEEKEEGRGSDGGKGRRREGETEKEGNVESGKRKEV